MAGPIAKISKGLCKLSLSQCGLTAKGVNQIAHSLSLNQSISSSLTHLDLSGNNLKDEINVRSRDDIRFEQCVIIRVFFSTELVQFSRSTEYLGALGHFDDGYIVGKCK